MVDRCISTMRASSLVAIVTITTIIMIVIANDNNIITIRIEHNNHNNPPTTTTTTNHNNSNNNNHVCPRCGQYRVWRLVFWGLFEEPVDSRMYVWMYTCMSSMRNIISIIGRPAMIQARGTFIAKVPTKHSHADDGTRFNNLPEASLSGAYLRLSFRKPVWYKYFLK